MTPRDEVPSPDAPRPHEYVQGADDPYYCAVCGQHAITHPDSGVVAAVEVPPSPDGPPRPDAPSPEELAETTERGDAENTLVAAGWSRKRAQQLLARKQLFVRPSPCTECHDLALIIDMDRRLRASVRAREGTSRAEPSTGDGEKVAARIVSGLSADALARMSCWNTPQPCGHSRAEHEAVVTMALASGWEAGLVVDFGASVQGAESAGPRDGDVSRMLRRWASPLRNLLTRDADATILEMAADVIERGGLDDTFTVGGEPEGASK